MGKIEPGTYLFRVFVPRTLRLHPGGIHSWCAGGLTSPPPQRRGPPPGAKLTQGDQVPTMPTVKIKTYYICQGSVRGSCGVRHRTESTAEACCAADHRGCQSQGGYSDRRPVKRTVSMLRGV